MVYARSHQRPTALLAWFVAVAVSTATVGCGRSDSRVVGLIYLPQGSVGLQTQRQVEAVVHHLANDRFRGPPDTIDGMVYVLGSNATTSRYLLLLPYGDREQSMVNDTAVAYGLTLRDSSWTFSQKYQVPLGVGREIHILEAVDTDGDGIAEALLCVRTNTGDRSILTLTFEGTELRRKEQSLYSSARCPPGEVLP
ncbi:MAG: hypothetical protein A2Y78_06090 [Acidobacteria bacterium RBG_13_68_16]|nr:MAG: hypothetical protein A2Y78_06090 [Acidobacteria bacterium RBG_13_68_16]